MNDRDSAYSDMDPYKRMAAMTDTYGIDAEEANKVNFDALSWLCEVLSKAKATKLEIRKTFHCPDCDKTFTSEILDVEKAAKSISAIAKTVDIVARLTAFTQGKEDSRPGGGGSGTDWLQALTADQLKQVMAWVSENQAANL